MKILARYILKQVVSLFGISLFSFSGIYLFIDFFERLDNFFEQRAAWGDVGLYFLLKTPLILTQVTPMAVLIGVVVGLGIFNRNREIVAMRAAGCSPGTYTTPIIVSAFVLVVLHFAISETIAFPLGRQADRIWQHINRQKMAVALTTENIFYRGEDVIYQICYYNSKNRTMEDVVLYFMDAKFTLKRRIDAKKISWDEDGWVAIKGREVDYQKGKVSSETFQERTLPLSEVPEDFSAILTTPTNLDWLHLWQYTKGLMQKGYQPTVYLVTLHHRAASSFSIVIFALAGVLVILYRDLHAATIMGVGLALLLAFVYFVVFQTGTSLATAGVLPPFLGVWCGAVVFFTAGIYYWIRLF